MNSTVNVCHCLLNAHQVSPGTPPTVVLQLQTPAQLDLTTMESSVFHTSHAIREESGTILSVSVFAHKAVSPTVLNASDVLLANCMPTVDATAQKDFSSMESNVSSKQSTNVFQFQTPTGTELTVFVSPDSQQLEIHAIVKELLLETIVKDVLLSQTQSGEMESVNVTMVMLMLTVFVLLRLLSALHAMLVLSLTVNFKNVFHVLMDV